MNCTREIIKNYHLNFLATDKIRPLQKFVAKLPLFFFVCDHNKGVGIGGQIRLSRTWLGSLRVSAKVIKAKFIVFDLLINRNECD